jgi:hypothetical protein
MPKLEERLALELERKVELELLELELELAYVLELESERTLELEDELELEPIVTGHIVADRPRSRLRSPACKNDSDLFLGSRRNGSEVSSWKFKSREVFGAGPGGGTTGSGAGSTSFCPSKGEAPRDDAFEDPTSLAPEISIAVG